MRNLSLALCFLLIGCGGEDVEDGTGDTGQVVIDTGQAVVDAGVQPPDAAVLPVDDAGDPPTADAAGTPPDAGRPGPRPDGGGPQPPRDAGGGGGGGLTCTVVMMNCVMGCQDEACRDACVDRAQPGAHRRAVQAMMQCANANRCFEVQDSRDRRRCLEDRCMRQAQNCMAAGGGGGPPGPGADGGAPPNQSDIGPPPGPPDVGPGGGGTPPGQNRSCSEALGCANQCGAQNMQCVMGCFGGVPESNAPLEALFICMENNGCGMDFAGCGRCSNELQACREDR